MQAERFKIFGSEHGNDTGQSHCLVNIDRFDPGMGIGRAYEITKQHVRHFDVVDIIATALGKALVFDPFAGMSETFQLGAAFGSVWA